MSTRRSAHAASRLIALSIAVLGLAACHRQPPEPQPSETPTAAAPVPIAPPSEAAATPTVQSAAPAKLDVGATDQRQDPDRLLRYYAAALHARDWPAAARAWGKGSGVTAATLKAAYDRDAAPTLEIGKAQADGAAGSLYYEAPVVLRFGAGAAPERGTLTLRRVNGVPGASAEQLRWHIERATIGVGQ